MARDSPCGCCQRYAVVGAAVAVADRHAVGCNERRVRYVLTIEHLAQRGQRVATEHLARGHGRRGIAQLVAVVGLGVGRGSHRQRGLRNGDTCQGRLGQRVVICNGVGSCSELQAGCDVFSSCILAGQGASQAGGAIERESLASYQAVECRCAAQGIHGRAVVGLIGAGQAGDRQLLAGDSPCGCCQRYAVVGTAVAVVDRHAVGCNERRVRYVLTVEHLAQRRQRVATKHLARGHARCGIAQLVAVVGLGVGRGSHRQRSLRNGDTCQVRLGQRVVAGDGAVGSCPKHQAGCHRFAARVFASQRASQAGGAIEREILVSHQTVECRCAAQGIHGRAVVGPIGTCQARHRQHLGVNLAVGSRHRVNAARQHVI